jgi:hypothetical protein
MNWFLRHILKKFGMIVFLRSVTTTWQLAATRPWVPVGIQEYIPM